MELSEQISKTVRGLAANGIRATVFSTEQDVRDAVQHCLVPGMTVGAGDSETLADLGIYDLLRHADCQFLDKYVPTLDRQQKRELYIANFHADLFISGINALSATGKIYNLDGNGSRVAPIIYGPEKVLLICGTNKIVPSDDEAILRIKTIAAPADAKRLGKKTPCVKTGKCVDCKSVEKICNYYSIIQGQFDHSRIQVLLMEGSYGF